MAADPYRERVMALIQKRGRAEGVLARKNLADDRRARMEAEAARKKQEGNVFGRVIGGVASSLPAFFASGMNPAVLAAGGGAGLLAGLAGRAGGGGVDIANAFDRYAPVVGSAVGMGMAQAGANRPLGSVGEVPNVYNSANQYGSPLGNMANDLTIDPTFLAAMQRFPGGGGLGR